MLRKVIMSAVVFTFFAGLAVSQIAHAQTSADSKKAIKHLEDLGFEVTENKGLIIAKHEKRQNLAMKEFKDGFLVTNIYITKPKIKLDRERLLKFCNEMNVLTLVSRWYVDDDGDLAVLTWFPGPYNKSTFEFYLNQFEEDIKETAGKNFDEFKDLIQ